MRRTEQVQGLRLMKFEEIYERTTARRLSQHAASILGVSERTFRRWRDRFHLYEDTVMAVLELDTRYTARHFWEKLINMASRAATTGFTLQAHGRIRRRHAVRAQGRPLGGMMLHQDGSSHQWVDGQWWDLIVTMDDATSDIYSALFVEEEGTMPMRRRGCSVRCMLIAAPITILGRRGARWTNPIATGYRADPGLFAGGPSAPSVCSGPCRGACPRSCAWRCIWRRPTGF